AFDQNGQFSLTTAFATNGSADGVHTIGLIATDHAGNAAQPATFTLTLDTQAPSIAVTSLNQGVTLSAGSQLTGTADATGSQLVKLDYAFDSGQTTPVAFDARTGSFDTALDLSKLNIGPHTLTIHAQDAAGNTASATFNVALPQLIPLKITNITPRDGAD